MAISAVQPSAVRVTAASQMPSQSRVRRCALSEICPIRSGTRGVHLEEETVPVIEKRIEHNRDAIVDVEIRISGQLGRNDAAGMWFGTNDSDVESLLVEDNARVGRLAGGTSFERLTLRQLTDGYRLFPVRLVEPTVDVNGSGRAPGCGERRFRLCPLRRLFGHRHVSDEDWSRYE